MHAFSTIEQLTRYYQGRKLPQRLVGILIRMELRTSTPTKSHLNFFPPMELRSKCVENIGFETVSHLNCCIHSAGTG